MTRKERYTYVLNYFRKHTGHVSTELMFGSAFQLLCATLLSAQCTDKRINAITPELFRHYPDAKTMAKATVEEVLEYVKSVSYPNAKAKHLVEMSKMLVEKFGGECTRNATGGWAQDGKRNTSCVVRQTDIGCRYARLPCQSSSGAGSVNSKHTPQG